MWNKSVDNNLYNEIAKIILNYGIFFPKNGIWLLKIDNDEYLVTDSLGKLIYLKRNVYDNEWTGFKRKEIEYSGIDFDKLEYYANSKYLRKLLKKIG